MAKSRAKSAATKGRVSLGIGSWADAEYTGILYPKGLPPARRLATYATHFEHVEVNSSYYATPRREMVEAWAKQTPAGFTFHIKLHRALSQSPAKAGESPLVDYLLKAVQPLVRAEKFGVFLLVLPPGFGPDRHTLEELDALIERLRPLPLAVELRHRDWVRGSNRSRTLEFFRARKLVWVAVDMPRITGSTMMPAIDDVTHPHFAYMRLHGRNRGWLDAKSAADRHLHEYSRAELRQLEKRIRGLAASAGRVYVVANNHARDFAPKAALALQAAFRA